MAATGQDTQLAEEAGQVAAPVEEAREAKDEAGKDDMSKGREQDVIQNGEQKMNAPAPGRAQRTEEGDQQPVRRV